MTGRLADVLPEPPDGATLVLAGPMICGHLIVGRMDDRAKEVALADGQRWFPLVGHDADPMTWREITTYATTAYALGEVLASTQPPGETG